MIDAARRGKARAEAGPAQAPRVNTDAGLSAPAAAQIRVNTRGKKGLACDTSEPGPCSRRRKAGHGGGSLKRSRCARELSETFWTLAQCKAMGQRWTCVGATWLVVIAWD